MENHQQKHGTTPTNTGVNPHWPPVNHPPPNRMQNPHTSRPLPFLPHVIPTFGKRTIMIKLEQQSAGLCQNNVTTHDTSKHLPKQAKMMRFTMLQPHKMAEKQQSSNSTTHH